MREMKYYELVRGDYVQSGDEYQENDEWQPVSPKFIGKKYGYKVDEPTVPSKWVKVRRLVPDGFDVKRRDDFVPIDEQYGFEFEV